MRIVTSYLPTGFWEAIDSDTYDVCSDPDCSCRANTLVGLGDTETAAIGNLKEQIELRESQS